MKIRTPQNKSREQIPEGTYLARLLWLTDLGERPEFNYKGTIIPSAYKIEFTYELVSTKMNSGKPFVISEDIKNNNWEDVNTGKRSTFISRCRSLLGTDYKKAVEDPSILLGCPCSVTIVHNQNGYPKIDGQAGVGSVMQGVEVPELTNKPYIFSLDEPDMEIWDSFPEFKQNKIQEAINFNETGLAKLINEELPWE